MRRRLLGRLPDNQLQLASCDIQFSQGRYTGPCRIVQDCGPTAGVLICFPWRGKTKQIMANQSEVKLPNE